MFKVIIIGPSGLPTPSIKGGAIQTLLTSLINSNEKKGMLDIDLFTPKDSGLKKIPKYKNCIVHQINAHNIFLKFYCFLSHFFIKLFSIDKPIPKPYIVRVNQLTKNKKADFVLFESGYDDMLCFKKRNKITLFHVHSDYIKKNSRFVDALISKVDYFLPISKYIKNELVNAGANTNRIIVFNNSIDTDFYSFRLNADSRKKMRADNNVDERDFLFGYCGRLSKEKGVLELIKAFNMLSKKAKLLIIGGSNFDSNKTTDYVKELQRESKDSPNIVFSGFVKHEVTNKLLQICDVGVVPSVCGEACSLSLLEFTRSGVPTIAANVGGIKEFATSSTKLVEMNSNYISNLKQAMEKIMEEYHLLKKDQNFNNFDAKYSPEAYYNNFCRIIDLLKRGN